MRGDRALRRFGPSVDRLPWRSSHGARRVLGDEGQQALCRFEEALLATWSRDDAILAFG